MLVPSLWTDEDQKMLAELVRKRGMADVARGLKQIAEHRAKLNLQTKDWYGVAGLLCRVYDHIREGRPVKD